jgi:CheY-like chemotaxis protein
VRYQNRFGKFARITGAKPKTVLIVEDDYECAEALSEFLRIKGYRTLCVENGKEALARLEDGKAPELILLDMALPIMDGNGFLENFRRRPDQGRAPVVVTTGCNLEIPPEGVSAVVTKPIKPEKLLPLVQSLVG